MIYLLAILLLSACGKPPSQGEAYLYAQHFQALARAHNRVVDVAKVSFTFAELSGDTEQVNCSGGGGTVTIDSATWSAATADGREAIVLHVLGHCLLGRGHRDGIDTNLGTAGAPWSLMDPGFVSGIIYRPNAGYYEDELFTTTPIYDTH